MQYSETIIGKISGII